jgi:prophage DNA circulation protein
MSQISGVRNPWRDLILGHPASFRGIIFHVDSGGVSSGRRTVPHEYPKRNTPYAEDMGRAARRFQFTGYLVYRPSNPNYNYVDQRRRLYNALEADDAGRLEHPVFCPNGMDVICDRFTMSESRERGGYTQFDMSFFEAGKASSIEGTGEDLIGKVTSNATSAEQLALTLMNLVPI